MHATATATASAQVNLPSCLGPLLRARAWALVGDHHQLPPLVSNEAAREGGYGVSLFKLLCQAHPQVIKGAGGVRRMRSCSHATSLAALQT